MKMDEEHTGLPWDFLALVFALSVPLWAFGGRPLPLPINLPASALTTFVPATAAAILVYRRAGSSGVKSLISRAWDFKRITRNVWYVPALLLAPSIYVLSFAVMRVLGLPLPQPVSISLLAAPVFFVMFLISGAGEELGWTAYATEPVQRRWGMVQAGLILGVLWAIWHAIPFVQTRESAGWIVWQSMKTVAMRMVIVWLYSRSGRSVFAANLYHTTDNVSWALFPNYGTHYNPAVTAILTWLAVGIFVLGWGAQVVARFRHTVHTR